MSRPDRARRFEFDPTVSLGSALEAVRAALDDEGLTLLARGARDDDVRSVIVGGRKVVIVPATRVGQKA